MVRVRLTGTRRECGRVHAYIAQVLYPTVVSGWQESRTRTRPDRERRGVGRMTLDVDLPEVAARKAAGDG